MRTETWETEQGYVEFHTVGDTQEWEYGQQCLVCGYVMRVGMSVVKLGIHERPDMYICGDCVETLAGKCPKPIDQKYDEIVESSSLADWITQTDSTMSKS